MTKCDLGIVGMALEMILGTFHGTLIMCDQHKIHFPLGAKFIKMAKIKVCKSSCIFKNMLGGTP